MGLGDVKLAGLIGLVLGAMDLRLVAVAAMLGFIAGGVGAIVALAMGRDRKAAIPFGPYMALGAALAVFIGSGIAGLVHGTFALARCAPRSGKAFCHKPIRGESPHG